MAAGLTGPEPAASQRELDQLSRRVDQLDAQGTRGTVAVVSAVQAQLAELARNLGSLQGELTAHIRTHEREGRDRRAERHWIVGTGVAVVLALVAVLALLLQLVGKIR